MMRFLIDANLPGSIADVFDQHDHDAIHVRDCGLGSADDAAILRYASEHGRVVVTRDHDFGNPVLHPPASHCGVIIVRLPNRYRIEHLCDRIESFLSTVDPDEIRDAVVVIEEGRYRVRTP